MPRAGHCDIRRRCAHDAEQLGHRGGGGAAARPPRPPRAAATDRSAGRCLRAKSLPVRPRRRHAACAVRVARTAVSARRAAGIRGHIGRTREGGLIIREAYDKALPTQCREDRTHKGALVRGVSGKRVVRHRRLNAAPKMPRRAHTPRRAHRILTTIHS